MTVDEFESFSTVAAIGAVMYPLIIANEATDDCVTFHQRSPLASVADIVRPVRDACREALTHLNKVLAEAQVKCRIDEEAAA